MKILSLDTASSICTVAILEDKNLIKKIDLDDGLTHSEKLLPMIKQILNETNLQLNNIDLLVCDKGPGSFTGIRIGVATIMAFSDSLNIKSIGISSLLSLAYNIKSDGIICSLIDAKNSNCYFGLYELKNGKYSLLEDLKIDNINNILQSLKKYSLPITFVGTGVISYQNLITENIQNCIFSNCNNLDSYSLGLAGLDAFFNNSDESILPLYLRKSQAERTLEENNKNGN